MSSVKLNCPDGVIIAKEIKGYKDLYFATSNGQIWSCKTRSYQSRRKTPVFRHGECQYGYDKDRVHPTQKPTALMEYLVRTFSNEGDIVLDNCMGSGSTGVACVNTGRKFIGIELNEKYFDIAKKRIESAEKSLF